MKNATNMYKMICHQIIEYGHQLFINARKTILNNIELAERCTLTSITKMRHPINSLHNPCNQMLYKRTILR